MRGPVRCDRSRQSEERSPDPLHDQRCGRDMILIRGPNSFEKQTIPRHRKINAGTSENQSVIAAKCRNHDRCRHTQRTRISERGLHRRDRHAILRRVLDF